MDFGEFAVSEAPKLSGEGVHLLFDLGQLFRVALDGGCFVGFGFNKPRFATKAQPEQWGTPHAQAPGAG